MFFDKRFKSTLLTSVSMGAVLIGTNALANPEGANVVTGDIAINGLGTDHVIIQNDSNRAVVNWDKFSIGAGETTTINQITNDSAILNRVVTNNVSEIYGTLESNGQVFLVNESGIVIGASGIVDTNGLVASTLDVSNADFLGAGEMIFSQGIQSGGGIEVHGKIRSVSGGDIFLLSREITIGSTAEISSDGGYVGLGAGEEILLRPTDTGDGRISIRAGKGKIVNQGTIEGIAAELKAAGGNEYALAINNTGVVRATGYSKKGGKIRLGGGGKVRNTGKLVARKKVIVRSKKKIENSGQIKAGDGNNGGEIIFEAPEIEVKTDSILDVAGALGGGRIFVGGGYQGTQADSQGNAVDITDNAINVTVDDGAVLTASATQSGDAGEIVVWADGETVFAGDIVATAAQGRGGDVEVSGKDTLNIAGIAVDLKGSEGNGKLLLDPDNITITAGGTTGSNTIADADIETLLGSANVNVSTGGATGSTNVSGFTSGGGTDAGDVTFETGVRILWAGNGKLTVTAENDIKAEDNVIIQHRDSATAGAGGVVFDAGRDIIIGKETGRTAFSFVTGNGGAVSIGSEHGENSFTAGNDVFVVGGNAQNSFAHLGFVQNASDSSGFSNGKITVHAGNDVTLRGGDELGAFAQIGHGGAATVKGIADISGDIEVKSDTDGSGGGDVILTHAVKDSAQSGAGFGTHAQIGHGSFITTVLLGSDEALTQGDISGNISITTGATGNTDANLKINTEFADSDDGNQDAYLSQIGHGGNIYYFGTTVAGNEITYGDISGDITLDINGKVEVGVEAAPGDGKDEFVIQGQIGHGGLSSLNYNGGAVNAGTDNSFDAVHGNISGDINVTAAQVDLIAKDAAQNSALGDGTLVDNSQQSQIGHGSTTVFSRDVGDQFGATGGEIPPNTTVTLTDTTNRFHGKTTGPANDTLTPELNVANAELATVQGEIGDLNNTITTNQQIIDQLQPKIDAGTATAAEMTALTAATTARNDATTDLGPKETTRDGLISELEALKAFIDEQKIDPDTTGTESTTAGRSLDVARNVTITENRISGDIKVTDDTAGMTTGINLTSGVKAGDNAITKDVMVTRIGHASVIGVDSLNGSEDKADGTKTEAFNGGNVTIRQAHILGADITVDTKTLGDADDSNDFVAADDQDISLKTSIAAGLGAARDNTAVAQIGHGADVYVTTGTGGASTQNDINSGDGGDVTLIRGTVWDGGLVRDNDDGPEDGLFIINTTDIAIISSNEVIVDSDTAAALAPAERNNSESSIGHGFKQRLVTGDGGTSGEGVLPLGAPDGAEEPNGAAGGAGGDILVYQGLDVREYGIDQGTGNNGDGLGQYDDYAYGLRGDITISATNNDAIAINLTSDDSSALSKADFNTDLSTIGHGDVMELVSGKGGDGAAGLDFEGDSNDPTAADTSKLDTNGQVPVYGGRGGHIDVQLGRHTSVDQYGTTGGNNGAAAGANMYSDTRQQFKTENQADIGDTRALTLGGVLVEERQGMSLIEGDIFVNVLGGAVNVAGSINNALSPSKHAISESIIGHAQRFTADAGDGGDAGSSNYHAQSETVFQSEQIGEEFLNYSSGTGSNRGGNGGDVRLIQGDITDRNIHEIDTDGHAEITHDTDADHSGTNVSFDAASGYSQNTATDADKFEDGSSDIFMYLSDKGDSTDPATAKPDSLTVVSSVNAGLSETNGSVFSTVGHHVRLIGEGGKGGAGGSSNTEFDQDGNSLFVDKTGQTDTFGTTLGGITNDEDGVDETAVQAGAVYVQPNASGGRGGDAAVGNNNISGDIVILAARRVTVKSGDGHGANTIVVSSLGHTTDLFSATQAGGVAGSLKEPAGTDVTFDGGIINVGGGQNEDNGENSSTTAPTSSLDKKADFDHVLIDGNRDDEFNLEGTDLSTSNTGVGNHDTISEDGIAVTDADRAAGKGSTFASINTELKTLVLAGEDNMDGIQTYTAADDNVIFHDEEADPNFILDNQGAYVLNTEANNASYAANDENLERFGRVVATYDGTQEQPASENFFSVSATANINPGTDNHVSLEVFVDMDLDGDVDLVDFDRDGRLDIVDVDRDGKMDVIDGRANYVDVLNRDGVVAVPQNGGNVNGISGLGVLDYVAVTGKGYNQDTANSTGENWTNHNELKTADLLSFYNGGSDTDFTAYVSDFSTANGGRGGDAYTQVGYSSGDISVSTGDNDKGEADTLIVLTSAPDAVAGNGKDDYLRAIIGHNAVQISDAGGEYSAYRVGREGLNTEADEHVSANGGAAGDFAINGNGGRGGNAALIQGVERDHSGYFNRVNIVNNETDHLVGDIYINTPGHSGHNDPGRISISSEIGALSPSDHNLVSQIGHSSLSAAVAGDGGVGASAPKEEDASSQTELANGGDGGQAYLTANHIKGDITVMAGSDDLDGSSDFSIELTVKDAHPLAGENLMIAQIGHGRQAEVEGGNGGDGDDGQFRANGGAGGNATLTQNAILDSIVFINLVNFVNGYDGNGLKLETKSVSGEGDIYRTQIGHGDLAEVEAGNGGKGTPNFKVKEQRNQTANGGIGGDGTVNQAGYSNDIILNIGSNETGSEALQVLSSAAATTNKADDHLLATIGHGGLASAVGGNGGDGGNSGAVTGIPSEVDPNLRDGDYFDRSNDSDLVTIDSDSAGVIDQGNHIVLGTTRRGGDAGDGVVNQNIGGTGRTLAGRTDNNDYGVDDANGADITIKIYDQYDFSTTTAAVYKSGSDGVLIQTTLGAGGNQDSALHVNSAIVGHHNFAEGTGGTGGNGAPSNLSDIISDGDGGDGGSGVANIYEVRGNISIDNNVDVAATDYDNSGTDKDTNITIETINGSSADAAEHRGEARVGHMSQAQTTGGDGGESAREAGAPPAFPATISTQGGDGGDALTFQGQQEGNITLTAENSVIVSARDTTSGAGALVAAVGHRVFAEAKAGNGNYGGTYVADPVGSPEDVAVTVTVSTTTYTLKTNGAGAEFLCDGNTCYPSTTTFDQTTGAPPPGTSVDGSTFTTVTRKSSVTNPYFTYEALREFHHRRTTAGGTDAATYQAAFDDMSEFEQKLIAPVIDYFENKEGELEIFLDRLIGDSLEVIQHNERDDDGIGGGDFSIPTLVDGTGHIDGAGDGEIETLTAILAASGHGGNAVVTQGSAGLSGYTEELAASGDITITALAFDLTDAKRGITIEGVGGAVGTSFQLGHVGHQSEAHQVAAGDGKDVNGRNANANGIGGDGGDAVVDQYALNGGVDLVSNHKILVSARDTAAAAHETRAWVGHRLTIGSDFTTYRGGTSVSSGNGGDEESVPFADGHNGNGGDVFIYQRGVISGTARTGTTASTYDTEIALAALKDSDDNNSITIEAQAIAAPAPDVETHIGHDFLIHAVKAGDGGRQAVLSGPEGASEGLLEGNGGDIFIAQTDLGADIDIVGRNQVLITAITSAAAGNHSHLMIGHERTIGNSAELKDDVDGGIADNPRTGTIVAGFGGDAHIEDVNGTAMASRVAAAQGIIEDGDSGRIEIALGKLTDSVETTDDTRLVTITSITEDVDVLSNATLGKAILEIGNQQQVIAKTQSAGELQAVPYLQTAGDAGGIFINRDTINGDILIQAIDADRANSSKPLEGKQVVIDSTSGGGSGKAITQIGHETQFTADTSVPVTARAAFGEDREFLFKTNLTAYIALDPAGGTANPGEATLRDAQNAVEDMRDVVRALELASENADRFPADDGVAEAAGATADRGEIFTLLGQARTALSNAESDLDSIGHNTGDPSEADVINAVMGHAKELVTAATAYEAILDAGVVPNSADQIADFAEGGDIVYGSPGTLALDGNNGLNSHTDSITGVAALAHTSVLSIQHAPALTAEGFTVADTGIVEGNVDILSGRDSDLTGINLESVSNVIGNDTILANNFGKNDGNMGDFTTADDLDDSVVQITATANNKSLTEIGHRRIMTNTTSFGGGDSDGSPEEGGVAGDAGSIVTKNITRGDISVQAEEVVIQTKGALGDAELHLLHSSHTTNTAGWSDIQNMDGDGLLGNGGDIYNTTTVSGGVAINAETIASVVNKTTGEGDRKILATGVANTFIHMGHQAEDKNESKSDPVEPDGKGDAQTNLGSNRGGKVVSSQSVTGNSNGDLVIITLDAAGDGNASDLIIETAGTGGSDIRLGNGEDGTMNGIYQDGTSGLNQNDDGAEITLTQKVAGNINVNTIEDLHINVDGEGGTSVYIGHDAEQLAKSGEINAEGKDNTPQYGERVTVTQTITGNVNVETTSSYTASLAAKAGELHVGHEGTQSAFSADDSANPSDFQAGNTASAGGVNDSFDNPDVMATQTIEAGISIVTGEITLENNGAKATKLIHYGHEATHKAAVDGDLVDADGNSTGHVVASSKINAGGSDIYFEAKGSTVKNDTVVNPAPAPGGIAHGTEGDIQLESTVNGTIHVGHRSTSTMGDQSTSPKIAEGQFNAEQIIGTSTLASNGEVENTGESVIEFRAVQDIIVASVDGETQVGHFIVETGNATSIAANNLNVDGNAATGLAEGDSELRQIVGSDIIFGDKSNQGSGGVGTNGAGNNVVIATGASGTTIIGHQSPETNEWQKEGTRSVTVQLLDGDITIESGTDNTGTDAPNGTVLATVADAIDDETGDGDDLLILSGAMGTARIGHNMAGVDEGVFNETQRSAGDIWVRAGGDMLIDGGAIGHEHYDFAAITPTNKNATPESLASGTPIRDRIRGNTTIAAGQNSSAEDSTTIANILKIDGSTKAVEINSGYGGQGGKDVAGQLRFFLPAQEGLTVDTAKFNDSDSSGDKALDRSNLAENIFENEGGNDHEHFFELASETAEYTDEFIGAGNFTFYFEPKPATGQPLPEFSPFLYRGSNDSGFDVIYLDDDGTSAGGAMNTDGLSEDYIGTSSFEVACDEQSQNGSISQEGSTSSGECSEVSDQYEGIQPGYGANTEWSGQAGGNASSVIPYLDEDDELGENKQVVGFTVYDEPVITTQTIAVEQTSNSYFNVKTVTRKLPKYDGRVITRNSPSGVNPFEGFNRTVTNQSPLKHLKSPITTTTQGSGVNSFDVSNNAVFSTTTHQFFTGFDAGNDYQVTAVDNRIGTYVDDTGIDAYMAQHAGAMSFASSYQVFEQKAVE